MDIMKKYAEEWYNVATETEMQQMLWQHRIRKSTKTAYYLCINRWGSWGIFYLKETRTISNSFPCC